MAEKTTESTHRHNLKEILDALGIKGEILSCGFNTKKLFKNKLEKELVIRTLDKPKKVIKR